MVDLACVAEAHEMTERELGEHLSDLLSRWHCWAAGHVYAAGFASVNAACRMARASRQYDDENGSIDAQIDVSLLEAVDAQIEEIPQPWRTALQVQARNLATGAQVWSSPRLPSNEQARRAVLVEARRQFAARLARAELL